MPPTVRSLNAWVREVTGLGVEIPPALSAVLAVPATIDAAVRAVPAPDRIISAALDDITDEASALTALDRAAEAEARVTAARTLREQAARHAITSAVRVLSHGGLDEVLDSLREVAAPHLAAHARFVAAIGPDVTAADVLAGGDSEIVSAWRDGLATRRFLDKLVRMLLGLVDVGVLPPRDGPIARVEVAASVLAPTATDIPAVVAAAQPVRIDPLGAAMAGKQVEPDQPLGPWRRIETLRINSVVQATTVLGEYAAGDTQPLDLDGSGTRWLDAGDDDIEIVGGE